MFSNHEYVCLLKLSLSSTKYLLVWQGFVKEFFDAKRKFHWRFILSMERPRIVYAVISSMEIKDNLFAQVVVRLKIKQVRLTSTSYFNKQSASSLSKLISFRHFCITMFSTS